MLRKLGIEPGERAVFFWSAAALLLIGWAEVSVTNVAETLFVKRVGVRWLPVVFLANSALLVVTTYAVGQLAARRDRLGLLPIVLAWLGLALLPLWALVQADVVSALPLLVIASKQLQAVALVVFWVAMGDLLHGRQAKRLFAPLMAGITLGTIAGSFASQPIGDAIGIAGLLPVSGVALGLAALMTLPLRAKAPAHAKLARARLGRDEALVVTPTGDQSARRDLWRESRLFRLLFAMTLCSGVLGPMLYFQFQYVASLSTAPGAAGESELLAFYARFRGWLHLGILVVQLAATSRLYRQIGIPLAAAASPLIYLLGFTGLSVRLSLPAGVAALSGAKIQDNAIYDPAVRVLFNLFPERTRAQAAALLEPIKRVGGLAGNGAVLLALALGSALWVGAAALPIALAWLGVTLVLWRRYPALLLQASSERARLGDEVEMEELLDPSTVRELSQHLLDADPERCRAAVALIEEAAPQLAVDALAWAIPAAPQAVQPVLVAALDRLLEESAPRFVPDAGASRALKPLLAEPGHLSDRDRADLVQAYGRLSAGLEPKRRDLAPLERALEDSAPAVWLAALAALDRCGALPPDAPDCETALLTAVASDDAAERRTAREELRSRLLEPDGPFWSEGLAALASLMERDEERADVCAALADVALRQGGRSAAVAEEVLAWREDPDPNTRAALVLYCGRAGLRREAGWIVGFLSSPCEVEVEAAHEALRALGPAAVDVLLVELSFGKRSLRNAVLPILQDLRVEPEVLRKLYEEELAALRRKLVDCHVVQAQPELPLLAQRLEERLHEGLHTAILFLAAIHDEDRIAELGERWLRAPDRKQRAILLEALEAFLSPLEKAELLALLEEADPAGRASRNVASSPAPMPPLADVIRDLRHSRDKLTRIVATSVRIAGDLETSPVAGGVQLVDPPGVLSPIEIALQLRTLPLFEGLTTRQLVDLAEVVREVEHPADATVVREGEHEDCMYLLVEGSVRVMKGDTVLQELGPKSFFGEVALLAGVNRSASVVAKSPVRLLRLEQADLLRLMEELPSIAIAICQTLSRRLRELSDRIV